jgi:hypothetical protein
MSWNGRITTKSPNRAAQADSADGDQSRLAVRESAGAPALARSSRILDDGMAATIA